MREECGKSRADESPIRPAPVQQRFSTNTPLRAPQDGPRLIRAMLLVIQVLRQESLFLAPFAMALDNRNHIPSHERSAHVLHHHFIALHVISSHLVDRASGIQRVRPLPVLLQGIRTTAQHALGFDLQFPVSLRDWVGEARYCRRRGPNAPGIEADNVEILIAGVERDCVWVIL